MGGIRLESKTAFKSMILSYFRAAVETLSSSGFRNGTEHTYTGASSSILQNLYPLQPAFKSIDLQGLIKIF